MNEATNQWFLASRNAREKQIFIEMKKPKKVKQTATEIEARKLIEKAISGNVKAAQKVLTLLYGEALIFRNNS